MYLKIYILYIYTWCVCKYLLVPDVTRVSSKQSWSRSHWQFWVLPGCNSPSPSSTSIRFSVWAVECRNRRPHKVDFTLSIYIGNRTRLQCILAAEVWLSFVMILFVRCKSRHSKGPTPSVLFPPILTIASLPQGIILGADKRMRKEYSYGG